MTAISTLNSSITSLDTVETGTGTSSYGTVTYYKVGHICTLYIACSGISSSGWIQIASGLPKAYNSFFFTVPAGNATTDVTAYVTSSGTLHFTGRGSIGTITTAITYVCQ